MSRGRSTTLITTRIPDVMFDIIEALAERKGMTRSEYVRSVLESHINNALKAYDDEQIQTH